MISRVPLDIQEVDMVASSYDIDRSLIQLHVLQ